MISRGLPTMTVLGICVGAACSTGCNIGKASFMDVQICLRSPADVDSFKNVLRDVAKNEGLRFEDHSAESDRALSTLANAGGEKAIEVPAINVGAYTRSGVGFGGGNLGMPDYQVSIGFSEGNDPHRAQALARRVVSRLSSRWHVETRLGVDEMENCPPPN